MTVVGLLSLMPMTGTVLLNAPDVKRGGSSQYLKLPGGIPSHDTFNRICSLLEPMAFHDLFTSWVKEMFINEPLSGVVAVDGKTVRGLVARRRVPFIW